MAHKRANNIREVDGYQPGFRTRSPPLTQPIEITPPDENLQPIILHIKLPLIQFTGKTSKSSQMEEIEKREKLRHRQKVLRNVEMKTQNEPIAKSKNCTSIASANWFRKKLWSKGSSRHRTPPDYYKYNNLRVITKLNDQKTFTQKQQTVKFWDNLDLCEKAFVFVPNPIV